METINRYLVTIPIAWHFTIEVDAEDIVEAKEKAYESDESSGDIQWVFLDQFNSGNVCHCPSPWKIEAELIEEDCEDENE